jgi:hypothetical protein
MAAHPASYGKEVCPKMPQRGVLTLAFGKPMFLDLAKALARSLRLHDPEVPRAVVTDSRDPELLSLFDIRIDHHPEYGSDVGQKLYLDLYSPFDETLFIDSDCLVIRKLDPFWTAFQDRDFGACGRRILRAGEKDEFVDVDRVLEHFGLDGLPKFNGGIYYFKKNPAASRVFETARGLIDRADELGFRTFRGGGLSDEALYSVAMALHGIPLTDMAPGGMWTGLNATSSLVIDTVRGVCSFAKAGEPVTPDIMHFTSMTDSFPYLRECRKLEKLDTAEGKPSSHLPAAELMQLRMTSGQLWLAGAAKRIRRKIGKLAARRSLAMQRS